MYLKKIIASGFKSFAEKTNIDMSLGITGIVGPNGSGKSNVVDAVRWVLGEQSIKSLRADLNMTEVIFSGSNSRKPQNTATVTLVFDNKDRYLKIDYDEVSIKRRVYKDGTNEYSINDEKCRLKDVTNLFLDTGIARESFNIISQGKVSEIITSKPVDRRVIFEEAASVLKYKKRKEEALRKLDKTNDNLKRVEDIINELESQVNPLREQKIKALNYQKLSGNLENIEIALITNDITSLNIKYQTNKEKIKKLNEEILSLATINNKSDIKEVEYKNEIEKLSNIVNELQKKLILKVSEVEKLNSEKNILLERKKYEVEDIKLHNNLVNLKEQELKYKSDLDILKKEVSTKENNIVSLEEKRKDLQNHLDIYKKNKIRFEQEISRLDREKNLIENTINMLYYSIENNATLPYSVKTIIQNPKLKTEGVIGDLIQVCEEYSLAITTSLGSATSYIVTKDLIDAKEAIKFLKTNNIGRATFYPMNVIKSKFIDYDTINKIQNVKGYVGIASSLVQFDSLYKNIIENLLGNIIVADNIDSATVIGKIIHNQYRIVTLDGELLHVGGSITGGKFVNNKNIITEKYELEKKLKEKEEKINQIKVVENQINENDYSYQSFEDKIYLIEKEVIENKEYIASKNNLIADIEEKISIIQNEKKGINGILNGNLSDEENVILDNYYKSLNEKENLELNLENNKKRLDNISNEYQEFEFNLKKENSVYNSKNKELNALEIETNRIDVKLDTLLSKLSETYNITYEKAQTVYKLEIEENEARNMVSKLKNEIRELGPVNMLAIEEFDKANERYEFLLKQKEELINAENTLLQIIDEMDLIMISSFKDTFELIRKNFIEAFKELFKGGNADLKLTNPDNLLETGIDIVACPPGKGLKSITLLSGGEMTLTAIALLFAILKSRPVPFCILDEVEAALDEVNVESFGQYLNKFKQNTQFILITHKKKTMEYADNLYGITMQESGVSKLVSVRLEDIK